MNCDPDQSADTEVPHVTGSASGRVAELSRLEPGWLDGEGAGIGPGVISLARTVDATLVGCRVASPAIFATPGAGVLFEWQRPPWELSIEVRPDLSLCLFQVHESAAMAPIVPAADQPGLAAAITAMNGMSPASHPAGQGMKPCQIQ